MEEKRHCLVLSRVMSLVGRLFDHLLIRLDKHLAKENKR